MVRLWKPPARRGPPVPAPTLPVGNFDLPPDEQQQLQTSTTNLDSNDSVQQRNHQAAVTAAANAQLQEAAATGKLDVVRALLTRHDAVASVHARNRVGSTPLHLAAAGGHVTVVQYLVQEAGANIQVTNMHGHSPLHVARVCEQAAVVQFLQQAPHKSKNSKGHKKDQQQAYFAREPSSKSYDYESSSLQTSGTDEDSRGEPKQAHVRLKASAAVASSLPPLPPFVMNDVPMDDFIRQASLSTSCLSPHHCSPNAQPAHWPSQSPPLSPALRQSLLKEEDDAKTLASQDLSLNDFIRQASVDYSSMTQSQPLPHSPSRHGNNSPKTRNHVARHAVASPTASVKKSIARSKASPRTPSKSSPKIHRPESKSKLPLAPLEKDASIEDFIAQGIENEASNSSLPPLSPKPKEDSHHRRKMFREQTRQSSNPQQADLSKESSLEDMSETHDNQSSQVRLDEPPFSAPTRRRHYSKSHASQGRRHSLPVAPLTMSPDASVDDFIAVGMACMRPASTSSLPHPSARSSSSSILPPTPALAVEASRGFANQHAPSTQDLRKEMSVPSDCAVGIPLEDSTASNASTGQQRRASFAATSEVSSMTTFTNSVNRPVNDDSDNEGNQGVVESKDSSYFNDTSELHQLALALLEQDPSEGDEDDEHVALEKPATWLQSSLDSTQLQAMLQHGTVAEREEKLAILYSPQAGFFLTFCRKTLDMMAFCGKLMAGIDMSLSYAPQEKQIRVQSLVDDALSLKTSAQDNAADAAKSMLTLIAEMDEGTRISAVTRVVDVAAHLDSNHHLQRAVVRLACHLVRARAANDGSLSVDEGGSPSSQNLVNLVRRKRFYMFRRLSQSLHSLSDQGQVGNFMARELLQVDTWAREEGHVAADIAMDILLRKDSIGSSFANGTDHFVDLWALAFTGLSSTDYLHNIPRIAMPLKRGTSQENSLGTSTTTMYLCEEEPSQVQTMETADSAADRVSRDSTNVGVPLEGKERRATLTFNPASGEIENLDHSEAREELKRLFSEGDLSLTDTDKNAMLVEMDALIKEQRKTILCLQKRLERAHKSNTGEDKRRQRLSQLKRSALQDLWDRHQEDLKRAELYIMVGTTNAKKFEKKNDRRVALAGMDRDSLMRLWKQHQKAQESEAWKYI